MVGNSEYTPIALAAAQVLVAEPAANIAVYLPGRLGDGPLLYRQAGVDQSRPNFERLERNGVSFLYIKNDDLRQYERALADKLPELLGNPCPGAYEKATVVQQVGTSIARDLTNGSVSPEGLARASRFVDTVIGCVLRDTDVAAHILHLVGHERTTAGHMFAVSALSIMLGAEVFGADQRMLAALGLAGMTHDIGKLAIDANILNKRDPLTWEELRVLQQHPIESVRLLGNGPHVTPTVRQMILQHHERIDGRGYPLGISRDDLLPGTMILSIVDSFHDKVGDPLSRAPVTPPEANRVLATQANKQFDAEFLCLWMALCERYLAREGVSVDPEGDLAPQANVAPDSGVGPDTAGQRHEAFCRHEHDQVPRRGQFAPRPKRHPCYEKVTVKCRYAGRLADATCAPDDFRATVLDVSTGGLCLHSTYPMYPGEVVHVQLNQGSHHIWVRGTVAWCRQHEREEYRTGLRFVQRLGHHEAHRQVPVDRIS